MSEEEVLTEDAGEESSTSADEGVGEEYFTEDAEIEGLSVSDVELFLLRAEVWDNLIHNKITINEAQNIISSLNHQQPDLVKLSPKRSRKKKLKSRH